jgi:Mg2+ and Co2+ transporter CorA
MKFSTQQTAPTSWAYTVRLDRETAKQLKSQAALDGLTINDWIVEAIREKLNKEDSMFSHDFFGLEVHTDKDQDNNWIFWTKNSTQSEYTKTIVTPDQLRELGVDPTSDPAAIAQVGRWEDTPNALYVAAELKI